MTVSVFFKSGAARRYAGAAVIAVGCILGAAISGPGGAAASTVDHSKLEELKGPFATGPDVTKACLQCHTEAAKELHNTTHWSWAFENPVTGQQLGKRNVINNFCVATATNWARCTSCHIGYGWEDDNFDHSQEAAVDCLVCHESTGEYKKFPTGAGHPNYAPQEWPAKSGKIRPVADLARVAQSVGMPTRQNCGVCHFYGGGGDGVKHGDLDSSIFTPDKALDVHMDADGLNFTCQTCHTTGSHQVAGSRYLVKAADKAGIDIPGKGDGIRASCESCHGTEPHPDDANAKLNDHTDRIACQTCHIPEFARGGRKTKTWWDWSLAGQKDADGKGRMVDDADGYPLYDFKKGEFRWDENVKPEYRWFNGEIHHILVGERINPQGTVTINPISGAADDPNSRIWPFKVMYGKQPYDVNNRVLGLPHLFGKDETAFWGNFDWNKALQTGLMARGVDYSGEYGFVETEYFWPITHMVAPGDQALRCVDCHARDGRMAGVPGFYMPGRDFYAWLDIGGWGLVGLTLFGVAAHGMARVVASRRKRNK